MHKTIVCYFLGEFLRKGYKGAYRIALFLSAGAKNHEWGVDNYSKLLIKLNTIYKIEVILLGAGDNTENYGIELESKLEFSVINLIGKTSIRETIALLKNCDLYIGGDTGPMHMAAACGLKGVAISKHAKNADKSNASSKERFGPWKSQIQFIQPGYSLLGCENGCDKLYAHYIKQVSVENVYDILISNF